jgi:hypothetical protein
MTKSVKAYEDLMRTELNGGRCTECGAELALTIAVVVASGERVAVRCRGCGMEHGVQEITYLDAMQSFVSWLQDNRAAPHNQDVDQVSEVRGKLQVLAFARFAFAHLVEEFRAHGGTDIMRSGLMWAQTALATATTTVDESDCRRTLLLSGGEPNLVLAHSTRATLAFSAYSRYTRNLVEALVGDTNCPLAAKPLPEADPELAQAYDELCSGTYTELREAVCALREASRLPIPPNGTQ